MGHVLIMEDATLGEMLREMLKTEGYSVIQVTEGKAALDTLRSSPQHFVVLLDYRMQGMDRKGLLQMVSRDATLSTRHAYVLLTARTRISLPVLESAKTLAMPVMCKPFDLEALLVIVADAQHR